MTFKELGINDTFVRIVIIEELGIMDQSPVYKKVSETRAMCKGLGIHSGKTRVHNMEPDCLVLKVKETK